VPTIVLGASENRKLRIITVGGGFSGVMLAYNLERELQNVEHTIYEKNSDIGGTWVILSPAIKNITKSANEEAMLVQ
jgi:ribulose 1,5-bisphosphate synthetase/thiazole synthase